VIRLVGGRIIDPAAGRDEIGDVLIQDDRLIEHVTQNGETVIDVSGYVVAPGFVDLHCHLREPGFEDA
jgi:dihydroorotase